MKRDPLATVEHGFDENWRTKVKGFRVHFSTKQNCQTVADIINFAAGEREAPLLALLSEARANLEAIHDRLTAEQRMACKADCPTVAILSAIDALDPGEWVPAAKYRELERVLSDLQEELGKKRGP